MLANEGTIEKVKNSFYQTALNAYKADYDRLIDSRKAIESKAQTTITVAGIFIAAVFAFIRELNSLNLSLIGKIILIIAVLLLTISVFCSIFVLLKRVTLQPLTGGQVYNTAAELIKKLELSSKKSRTVTFFSDAESDFLGNQIGRFHEPIKSLEKSNKLKGDYLDYAQYCLFAAIFLAGGLTFGIVFGI